MTMVVLPRSRVKVQLELLLPLARIDQAARDAGHRFRRRKLAPGISVHLLLVQLLHRTALQGLRHLFDAPATAAAICQARMRLPLAVFYLLIQQAAQVFHQTLRSHAGPLFHGLEVVLLDAMCFHTPDTPELLNKYGKYKNQLKNAHAGYPTPKLLCLMHCATGLITRAIELPVCRHEHMLLKRIASCLHEGQVVLADRGLVSYSFMAELLKRRVQACFRLPIQHFAHKGFGQRHIFKTLGPGDLLVTWKRPPCHTQAYCRHTFRLLPEVLTLRQVSFLVTRPGFRPTRITLITTLTDPAAYPASALADLYCKRWQVEVYFRDLKRTQGLDRLGAKTVLGVRKELLAQVLLYNLVRATMSAAALQQNVHPDRVSFTDTLRWLRHAAESPGIIALVINPKRHRPSEPRRLKGRYRFFESLQHPRAYYRRQLASPQSPALT